MFVNKWLWLASVLFSGFCAGWLDERPILESINGNLFISSAKDRNITLKILGSGNVNVNDINLLHAVWAAQNASRLVERWKAGILDDVESTLQRLTRIIEGPNGLVRKMSGFEFAGDSSANASISIVRPSSETQSDTSAITSGRIKSIRSRLRRLESKVRAVIAKLRTNECSSDPCQNGGTCIDSYDSFQCHCPPEWEGSLCNVDVNECQHLAGKPGGCQNGATCVNLPGSFKCVCPQGWYGFHCVTQKSVCDQSNDAELCGNGICIKANSALGYTCLCKSGWDHLGENDPSCRKDVDECTNSRYPCSVNPLVTCHNVPGTFYCGVCPAGYTGDGFKCQDIDECLMNNGGCSTTPLVECINTLGSRQCGPCPNGYQGDGTTCFYTGSCRVNNGGCHGLATCSEGPSMETLCLCPPGYVGTGKGPQGCQPGVSACKSNPCVHGTCTAQGADSFSCLCNPGYTGSTCSVAASPCDPNPCENKGVCHASPTGKRSCVCTAGFTGPTCATAKQSCGGFFRMPSGYVEFPANGDKYNHGLSCAWVISTNHSMVLNLTFTKFALEESYGRDECVHDYVQIHDGRSAGSQIFGRYCGSKLPNNGTVISTHNSLYIWFHSDSTLNNDGFAFNWTSIDPVCGGDINAEHGSLSSPGFPGKYPINRNCYWNINVQPGKRIAMNFISLELEGHPKCEYDYLEVYENNYAGKNQLGLYCNHSKPEPITTSGSHAVVHFHSDNSGTDDGFHLSFLSIAGAPDCGGVYTSEKAEIASPGYHSGSYRPGLNCDWELRLPEGSNIQIKWLKFDIERSRNCMFDSVQIYEGPDSNSPLVGRYCGSTVPPPLSIKSNRILIRFESDSNLEEKGFVFKYEVDCGGTFTEPSGIIKSPFYPNHYPGMKDCVYIISQPPGKAIVLTFEFLDIEEGLTIDNHNETECYFDRLEIRDGDMENSTLLNTLCGSEHNMPREPIYSTHNFMYLEFFTDANIHNHGFKLNYTTIDRECGGILRDAPGTLDMPGISGAFRTTVDCIWTIRAPVNHAIQFTWMSFPSRQSSVLEECGKNYIEIVESYGSSDSSSLGKYCPIKPPPQIMTSIGNDLTLHYHFSGDTSDINYQATFVFINDSHNCGGHYYAETGVIRSPNYPEKYPKNKECVWIIEAKNKYLVNLVIGSFELENSTKCSYDYLEIRSGSQENSPLIGKFCGKQIESELSSMTNQMYIKFVSDTSLQKKGFELTWQNSKSGCGGNLRSSSGSIISPNYPQNYYHRARCTWTIQVSAGSVIRITFIDFDLEYHAKCLFDYLEISDIHNDYISDTQKFCGSTSPSLLISKSNQIKLTFRTDVLTSSRGFNLRYTTECNNKLTGFQGVIESPNFPQSYENMSNCSWIISAPAGNRINITFSHFNIQASSNGDCSQDYVRIREGNNDEPNTELSKKCGSEEDVLPLKIFSSQPQVFINFVTNRYGVGGGFRLEWYINGCSKHLRKPSGYFTSPGYPNGDKVPETFIECSWLIEVDFDKSIEITFPKIDNLRSRTCSNAAGGSIEIYNGRDESAPLLAHELCYSTIPVTYTSTGNHLLVKYSSETSYASHGFTALYKSTDLKCGGKFTGQSGVIHSANYPRNYPHNQNCQWLITVDTNHAINLTFVDLDLEKSKNCSDDYVKVYDGDAVEAPLLGTHCQNSELLPYYVSTGNQLLVVMRTDSIVSAKGFKAQFNRTCGARIKVDGDGMIRSSPTLHTNEVLNCSWILAAEDPGDKINLVFTHIELLETEDCSSGHIEIYEGEGTDGPLLGQICNNRATTPFYSTGNALTIHMSSEYGKSPGDTFDAMYSSFSNACGGKYTAESGVIVSPKYPASYPSNSDCIWVLSNSPGNRISLSFAEFELLSSDNCDMDYVEIRERDGIGKLRGVYCGKNIESITASQPLWIRFKSSKDSIGNPKGFKATYQLLHGDELSGDFGEVTSPMYPRPFRKSETYSWRITVDFNYVIKITFLEFSFDNYDDYCYSSIKIYDGYNDEAPKIKDLCGITVPEEPTTSSSNIVFIEMENSFDHVGNLFRLKWVKVPRSTSNEKTEEIDSSENSKLIILNDQNKTYSFESPGYPDGYAENLKYSWTFVSPKGTHVVLKFLTMDLEEAPDCYADYVGVYDGYFADIKSDGTPIKKFCLSNSTMTSYSGTNVMTVQFVSDSYKNKTGFSAVAITECGGTIEEQNGIIHFNKTRSLSRFGVHSYVYSCEWIVKVRTGRRINAKVVDYNLETSQPKATDNSCRTNYLMMKNGESSSSPLLGVGKYCNGVKPPVQNTTSNYLYIKLAVSFASVNLKISFRELGHDCGGRFELSAKDDSQQEISSPNYPNIPTPHTECFWTFRSLDDHRLAIHFLDRFDLAFSEDCEKEYLEIRDGSTDTSPLLGRYCRNTPPSSISTRGNMMYVHYFTDIPEPRNGFKALITNGDVCGGIERETKGGVITSPNYPDTYDVKSQFCSWWIIAPTSNRGIKLQFQDLQLPIKRNCSDTDHVTVYEKLPGSFNNTEVGTYCGRSKPGVIDIVTSEALVIFESSFANHKSALTRGFRLNYTFNRDGCGSDISGMGGMFQSAGYPRPTAYKYCHWKITVPEGYQVVVDVIDLDLGGDKFSLGSHVSFHHDIDSIATISVVRQSSQSMRVASSSNYMSIYYISTGGHRGMKAKYTAVAPVPCGGRINDWEGKLTNPHSAPYNRSSFFCKWSLQQPETPNSENREPMTLAVTVSGVISRGKSSTACRSILQYVLIKGDEPVAKFCGNFTTESVTVASPFRSYSVEAINASTLGKVDFTVDYKWHTCGGILTGPAHVIQAPKNVSHPIHCAWKVKYPNEDDTILISFKKLNLAPCEKSYLQIKGKNYRSPTLGKFCGNEIPQNILSSTNELMIEYFATENTGEFEISIELSNNACGGVVTGKRTEIKSPGFPKSYENNTECIWEVIANPGHQVGFSFVERFNLETSKDCTNDYVEVYEWNEEMQNDSEHWKSLGRVCGRIPPETPFNSTTNRMKVKFVSNEKIEGQGFKGVWYPICGGVYKASNVPKVIESPNYPLFYPPNTICNYTILSKDEEEIVVDFSSFRLEGNGASCQFDNVTINSWEGDWFRGNETWCGVDSPGRKMSKGRMEIIFKTDNSVNRAGFKFKYLLNDCGGTITSPRMIMPIVKNTSDSYTYMHCVWVVKAPPKKSVLLRFEEFDIPQPLGRCFSNYVQIFEGNRTDPVEMQKAKFCGNLSKNLPVMQSTGVMMTIIFHGSYLGTDEDQDSSYKLKAAVLFVNGPEEGCGGNLNVTDTTSFRTQLAETYEPFQDCHWLINAPLGYRIKFTIDEIDFKDTLFNDTLINKRENCNSDYIEVRDGGPYSELIGHFCGNKAPPAITTSSNLLWIRFISDGLNQGRGAKGTFKTITSPCGLTDLKLSNSSMILTSPNYPATYGSNITCRWKIHGGRDSYTRIRIHFKDFNLQDSERCDIEYVQISEMDNRALISEGFGQDLVIGGTKDHHHRSMGTSQLPETFLRYCGSDIPHDYFSGFKDVEITYKGVAGNPDEKKGFKLEYGKSDCSRNFTELQGRILHDDVVECKITIQVPENYTISLYFTSFYLPGGSDCSKASMKIHEGGFDGHIIQTVCNYELPNPVFSTSNRLSIFTQSDQKGNPYHTNAYDITYTSTKNGRGCGGQLYNYGGTFSSPMYPNPYRNRSICVWDISVPKGLKVSLHFNIFDIGPKNMCDTDYLTISDVQPNGDEETMVTYCGGDTPADYFAQVNRVLVSYATSVNNGGSGWSAYFIAS